MTNLTDTELLIELISRYKLDIAPEKTEFHGEWLQAIIPIGSDNSAIIMLNAEDYEALQEELIARSKMQKAYY